MDDNLLLFEGEKNPFYSLQYFLIKLNFIFSELKNEDPNTIEKFAVFIHEYTHYLQTFTTINGLSALLSYIDEIISMTIEIGQNIITNKTLSIEIIKKYRSEYNAVDNILYWKKKSKKVICYDDKPKYFTQLIFNPIFKKQTEEVYIFNMKDGLFYHVSSLMLRENMAMMAYFKVRNIGQDSVMSHVNIYPSPETPYCCKYWLIFSYFLYKYPQINDVIKFTYYFCELALMRMDTGFLTKKLLQDIDFLLSRKEYQYINEIVFFEELFKKNVKIINDDVIAIEYLNNTIRDNIKKLMKIDTFYLSIDRLITLATKGIEYKKKYCTIYRDILDKRWVDTMSNIFLSPVILQPNKIVSTLHEDQNDIDLLGLLFGVSIIANDVDDNGKIYLCPFYEKIPICYLKTDKIDNICSNEPLKIKPFPKGGCPFYNSCLTLGLLPKDELMKYL
jgi:hypothetical protein